MTTAGLNVRTKAAAIMPAYVDTIMMLERLHRRMQEVVKDALDRAGID